MLSPLPEVVVQVHAPVYDYQGIIIMAMNEGIVLTVPSTKIYWDVAPAALTPLMQA
jgi:hypothetical protein